MKQSWEEIWLNGNREDGKYYNSDDIVIGVVKSISPIQILYGELPLNRENLLINRQLLEWTETVECTTSTNKEHSHTITTIKHKSCLQVGDSVLLYRIGNKYAVLGVVE